jgi:ferrous iron transport protein A
MLNLPDNGHLPLTMISPGQSVKLVQILAGRRLRHRLTELGLTPGVELTVMQDQGGPMLVSVYNSRLALGRGMAQKILVNPL